MNSCLNWTSASTWLGKRFFIKNKKNKKRITLELIWYSFLPDSLGIRKNFPIHTMLSHVVRWAGVNSFADLRIRVRLTLHHVSHFRSVVSSMSGSSCSCYMSNCRWNSLTARSFSLSHAKVHLIPKSCFLIKRNARAVHHVTLHLYGCCSVQTQEKI